MRQPYPRLHPTPPEGILTLHPRDGRGIVAVWGWGRWEPAYVDEHFAATARHLADVRAAGQPVRVLVNLQKASAQDTATIARLRAHARALYQKGDRVAIVVGSRTAKASLGGAIGDAEFGLFVSETAAVLWLGTEPPWLGDQAKAGETLSR